MKIEKNVPKRVWNSETLNLTLLLVRYKSLSEYLKPGLPSARGNKNKRIRGETRRKKHTRTNSIYIYISSLCNEWRCPRFPRSPSRKRASFSLPPPLHLRNDTQNHHPKTSRGETFSSSEVPLLRMRTRTTIRLNSSLASVDWCHAA